MSSQPAGAGLSAEELEAPVAPVGQGFSEAVTLAFGDAASRVYGVARLGLSGDGQERSASGLALLFADGAPIAMRAQGDAQIAPEALAGPGGWRAAATAGLAHEVIAPLQQWRCSFVAEDGSTAFAVDVNAISEPARLERDQPAAQLGGMEGYDQLVQVSGEATIAGAKRRIAGLGQRGHSWGAPDWARISVARTIGVWLPDQAGVTATAIRAEGVPGHAADEIAAFLISDGRAQQAGEARISTAYDNEGRQRRAGLELYVGDGEEEFAHRAAGEVVCGTTVDLGRLRLDCAFLRWRMDGRQGLGRYDVLRRVG